MTDKRIWSFVHEPTHFKDVILNPDIRPKLQKALDDVPNLLLYGTPGIGKGTFTKILLKHTKYDYIWINVSDETGIDTMRDKVRTFATALGITPLKIVVLNETDSMTSGPQGAQKMLRQLMEDVQRITRFILMANYDNLIIPEIKSRCMVIQMDNPPAKDIFRYASKILVKEEIDFDKKVLVSIVKKCYPDIRKTVWSIQENSIEGKLIGDKISASEDLWKQILLSLKKKDIETVRKTLKSNYIDYPDLYSYLYENVGEFNSPGDAILSIGQHLMWDSTVAIKEINFMHMVIEMMKKGVV